MRAELQHALVESTEAVYPIRYEQVGHLHQVPTPLVRVTTCGGFHLDVVQEVISVDPPLGRYRLITLEQRPKGSSTGLTLLKMLASRPEHYASKDWLAEYIPRMRSSDDEKEENWGRGLVRIDNVVSLLRSLLCPPGIAQEDTARKMLVAYIKNHKDSGPGYQLASLPLLWLDVDVIAATVQQACQQEQDGHDALAAWEQVYALAAKGSYLPQEPYSDWATDKRAEIDGSLKQAVLALRRLLLARYGEAGEERVLVLLRTYWQMHPMDEDVLRPLMELLSKRECVQEALECYQRLCEQVEQEGGTPHLRTQRTVENLRLGHIAPFSIEGAKPLFNTDLARSSHARDEPSLPFSSLMKHSIIDVDTTSEEAPQQSGTQDMEPSRRNFLQTFGGLSTGLFLAPHIQGISSSVSQASVAHLATITQQFRAMQRQGDTFIAQGVIAHIQTIQEALEQTMNDTLRYQLWGVLAQTQTVAGFNPRKKTERGQTKTFLEAAIASAHNSRDALLLGASLGHLAHFSLREEHNLMKATQVLHQAQEYVPGSHLLHGWFALIMASLAAKENRTQQCEASLADAMTTASHLPHTADAADLYFTDLSLTSAHIFAVNSWLTIGNAAKAYTSLVEMKIEDVADNRRASAYCDASRVYAMMGEFEMAQHCAFQAIDKAFSTRQHYVIPRCLMVAHTLQEKAPEKPYAAAITDYAHLTVQQREGEGV